MRKWFYAGAVVGGFLLLGAAPAQADVPAPADRLPSSMDGVWPAGSGGQGLGLDPAGGLTLESPLAGSSLANVTPGQNSPDLSSAAASLSSTAAGVQPKAAGPTADLPAGRKPAGRLGQGGLPTGALPTGNLTGPTGNLTGRVPGLPGGGLLGGGLPGGWLPGAGQLGTGQLGGGLPGAGLFGGGLLPDGRVPSAGSPSESALFDGGLPLLGGLGGLLPANEVPRTLRPTGDDATAPPVSGMPAGGTAVDQPARDPRVHEEPAGDETTGKKRSFSDGGRPVAGEDTEFK
jgi:hypothetical protein